MENRMKKLSNIKKGDIVRIDIGKGVICYG